MNNKNNSSKKYSSEAKCLLSFYPGHKPMPDMVEQPQQDFAGGSASFLIAGTLGAEWIDPKRWKEAPHKVLANLRSTPPISEFQKQIQEFRGAVTIDPKAAKAFIQSYGVFRVAIDETPSTDSLETGASFVVNTKDMQEAQLILRGAWEGDENAVNEIREYAFGSMSLHLPENDKKRKQKGAIFELAFTSLWRHICAQFLADLASERIAKCPNPDCPAPYFIKHRRNQRVCELGPCYDWVQRGYALKWWKRVGTKRRAKEIAAQRKGSSK